MTDPKDREAAEKSALETWPHESKFDYDVRQIHRDAFLAGCAYKQERILRMLRDKDAPNHWSRYLWADLIESVGKE